MIAAVKIVPIRRMTAQATTTAGHSSELFPLGLALIAHPLYKAGCRIRTVSRREARLRAGASDGSLPGRSVGSPTRPMQESRRSEWLLVSHSGDGNCGCSGALRPHVADQLDAIGHGRIFRYFDLAVAVECGVRPTGERDGAAHCRSI